MQFWSFISKLLMATATIAAVYLLFVLCIEVTLQSEIYQSSLESSILIFNYLAPVVSAIAGSLVTVLFTWIFFLNSKADQRRRATIDYILSGRNSEHFSGLKANRIVLFPEGSDIKLDDFWWAYWKDKEREKQRLPNQDEHASALAIIEILNFYEFLALGIENNIFDLETAKGTVRGIMCNLVNDARFVIYELREENPKTYQHLASLYEEWREKGNPNELPITKQPSA